MYILISYRYQDQSLTANIYEVLCDMCQVCSAKKLHLLITAHFCALFSVWFCPEHAQLGGGGTLSLTDRQSEYAN